ncbi:hypothetical protein GCM10027447_08780 [Glycomyces halotolerans]
MDVHGLVGTAERQVPHVGQQPPFCDDLACPAGEVEGAGEEEYDVSCVDGRPRAGGPSDDDDGGDYD